MLFSSTQALSQIFCPRKLAFWENLTTSRKVVAAVKQERPYDDLIWHRVLMMVYVTRTGRTKIAANVLAYASDQLERQIRRI